MRTARLGEGAEWSRFRGLVSSVRDVGTVRARRIATQGVHSARPLVGTAPTSWHSDSAMGHLLDQQYELGIRAVNYGGEVDVALIREKMPDAYIQGHMPPFLLRNGSPDEITASRLPAGTPKSIIFCFSS